MQNSEIDPLVKRAIADAVLERASQELKKLLHELASALDPFPTFLDLNTVQAIEVEPSGVSDPNKGCVVICPDGELRELMLRMLPGPIDIGGVDNVEEMKDLELSPGDYVAYAHSAVLQLTQLLEEQRAQN